MRIRAAALLLTLGLVPLGMPAAAHPPAIVGEAGEKAVGEEIAAFRKAMADAIRARDEPRVQSFYAPRFTHTPASGKLVTREAHIAALLAGEPGLETAPAEDLVVRVANDWVAVATGTSPLGPKSGGRPYRVRWTAVYTRLGPGWVLLASHATRSDEPKP